MSKILGCFEGQFGYVDAELLVLSRPNIDPIPVSYKIDTGSDITILFDGTFCHLCSVLGCRESVENVLNWISFQTDVFQKDPQSYSSPGGKLKNVFQIKESYLKFLAKKSPFCRCDDKLSVRCAFSDNFLNAPLQDKVKESRDSLLGVNHINLLKKLVWEYPDDSIILKL